MNNKKQKEFYKQWWFWGAILIAGFAVYFILNINQFTSQKFESNREIHLYTREIGSGTRSAFTSVTHLTDENEDDILSPKATVQNSTSATMQAVESDPHGISYISLGSLNSSVKAVSVDGVEPTIENIQTGDYELIRNFNVTYGQELSEVAEDFWHFMFSAQAQKLVVKDGYVPVDSHAPEYEPSELSGSISIVGSTSVEPTIQRFSEAYRKFNPNVTIDITAPGSGAGITSAIDGSADIGMSSREPDDDEDAQLIETAPIAVDGIVVIVNNNNPLENLEIQEIQGIYLEYLDTWNEILEN
ncbi:phosphate transport system substrate-binding protein [Atopostipes suicloacalis DSM 15692]|uniref:Phosphate transport system substrate-binding protein n=1 Tax=Atopostipes suicloacalis DSM 15692 TaxID=1121025 RepID=A0A1M4XYA1_9LACT|nr:substrate-binding domain-containing protein [Atopostipes suicloacalis]SHE98415.1 phosphate transport system substrate-binding protein [Atopostipes suicloacalis DSM 15692]